MEKNKNVFDVEIKVEKNDFEDAIKKAFDKKVNEVKVDGFRKGKVPFDVYVKKFGKQSLYMDAVDILLPEAYKKALDEGKYEPIVEPKIDLKEINENGCIFTFVITTRPEVKIKKYKGLKVTKEEVKVTKEEINAEIENMLKKYSELTIKEKGNVELGNIAIINFEGFNKGVAFDGGKAENYSLEIGSNTFIPGFEDQIIGMAKGEEKDIQVTFPKEYAAPELSGQEVTFKVKVTEIKEKLERKLDKDFFEDLGMADVKDKEGLEKEIKENLMSSKEIDVENKYVDDLLKEIAKTTTIDIPEDLINHEVEHMVHRFGEQLQMQGVSLDVYYEMTKTKEEDLKNQMKEEAKTHIEYRFILEEIQRIENITVTEEEIDENAKKTAAQYNMNPEEFLNAIGGIESMKYELEVKKVIDFLKENN